MYKNLKDFLKRLDNAGELKRIHQPVSCSLEISRYTDAESKSKNGGKALFFEKIKESEFPVATNIFGSNKRICMAMGVEHLNILGKNIKKYIEIEPPKSIKQVLSIIPMALGASNFIPRTFRGKTPPCQEIIYKDSKVDLSILPVLKCWPKDAGHFVTLPIVFTKSLATGKQNAGMYRLQIFDKNTTGMHWHIHKDGSNYYNEYRKANKRMPVAVAIGAAPAVTYAATAPMPRGMDEMLLAGFIRKKPVIMAKCLTNDLLVPAEAEFILEGYVDPGELKTEGPFGDHTGYYSLADDYPVFHVTAITHKKKPVYNATLVGRPPMEDCYLAKVTERLFLPLLQSVIPEIIDMWFPWEGVFHNIVIISINKEYAGHAQKVINGIWGMGQMSFCKIIVIVDRDIRPDNPSEVIKELIAKFDINSDIIRSKGVLDVLDHSSEHKNFGNKIGIDLTDRFQDEPEKRQQSITNDLHKHDKLSAESLQSLLNSIIPGKVCCRSLFSEYEKDNKISNRILVISIEKRDHGGKYYADLLLNTKELKIFSIFILFDKDIDLYDNSLILWKLFNNVDPERDFIIRDNKVVIDACKKGLADGYSREWPDELTLDE